MPKILLILRDEDVKIKLNKALNRAGFFVFETNPKMDILEQIRIYDPSLIFVDSDILKQYGEKLRKNFSDKCIIAWMAERNALEAFELIQNGAFDCLHKPLNLKEAVNVVSHALKYINKRNKNINDIFRKLSLYLPGTILILLILIFFLLGFFYFSNPKIQYYSLTYDNPTGIFRTENGLWTSDWFTQSVYIYSLKEKPYLKNKFYFPDYNPNGIAFYDNNLWVTGIDGYIRKYKIIGDELILNIKFKAPGFSPSGLCIKDNYIWSIDSDKAKIFKHSIDNLEDIISQYDYPGVMPVGLFYDGKNFWTADTKLNKIYCHFGPEKEFQIYKTYNIPLDSNKTIAGLSIDKKYLWIIVTGKPAEIIRYPLKRLR